MPPAPWMDCDRSRPQTLKVLTELSSVSSARRDHVSGIEVKSAGVCSFLLTRVCAAKSVVFMTRNHGGKCSRAEPSGLKK